jgi:hypothetical protein
MNVVLYRRVPALEQGRGAAIHAACDYGWALPRALPAHRGLLPDVAHVVDVDAMTADEATSMLTRWLTGVPQATLDTVLSTTGRSLLPDMVRGAAAADEAAGNPAAEALLGPDWGRLGGSPTCAGHGSRLRPGRPHARGCWHEGPGGAGLSSDLARRHPARTSSYAAESANARANSAAIVGATS